MLVKTEVHPPSPYQTAIYEWVKNGTGNAFVQAVAGAGKTTTLVESIKYIKKGLTVAFLAFNKDIVIELQNRLGKDFPANTLNSLGHRIIMANMPKGVRVMLRGSKYSNLIWKALEDMGIEANKIGNIKSVITELLSLSMAAVTDGSDESLLDVCDHYAISMPKDMAQTEVFNLVRNILKIGKEQAVQQGIISFDDQIYIPVVMGWKPRNQVDFVMVDEAQDLSEGKLRLAMSLCKKGGRMLFVGDQNQSIYGFAGADAFAVQNIIERTNATVLPLSISYRCPQAVIERAKEFVKDIEAAPTAPMGEFIEGIKFSDFASQVKPADMVLCRVTNPLVSACIKLLRANKAAKVIGRNVGTALVDTAKIALGSRPWDELNEALDEYMGSETLKFAKQKNGATKLQALDDKVQGVKACNDAWRNLDGSRISNIQQFLAVIDRIFSSDEKGEGDDTKGVIKLSTVHRVKGKEAHTVWNIAPEKNFLSWVNQREWEYMQEQNIVYVLYTRAKHSFRSVLTEKAA